MPVSGIPMFAEGSALNAFAAPAAERQVGHSVILDLGSSRHHRRLFDSGGLDLLVVALVVLDLNNFALLLMLLERSEVFVTLMPTDLVIRVDLVPVTG